MSNKKQDINYPPSKLHTSLLIMIMSLFDLKIMQTSHVMSFVD